MSYLSVHFLKENKNVCITNRDSIDLLPEHRGSCNLSKKTPIGSQQHQRLALSWMLCVLKNLKRSFKKLLNL